MMHKLLIFILLSFPSISFVYSQGSEGYVKSINMVLEQHSSANVMFTLKGVDSLAIKHFSPKDYVLTFAINDIYSLCSFKNNNILAIYLMSKKDNYPARYHLPLDDNSILDSVFCLFRDFFNSIGHEKLKFDNIWYQNDLIAEKLTSKIKHFDNKTAVWGIDSNQTGNFIYNYPHNIKRFDLNLINGIYHGEQKRYYINGKLESLEHYKSGIREGIFLNYDYSGILEMEQKYKDNQLDGLTKEWWSNGQIKSKKLYRRGKLLKEFYWDPFGNSLNQTMVE